MTLRLAALALLLSLAACEGETPPSAAQKSASTSSAAASVAATPAPPDSENAAGAQSEENAANIPVVSETSDDEVESSSTTGPTLKLAVVPPATRGSRFKEGVHYQRLSPTQPTNAPVGMLEVAEVFGYGCRPCFAIDAKVEAWRTTNKPAYVAFERLPSMSNPAERFHARIFFSAQLSNRLDALHAPLFRELNVNNNPLDTVAAVKSFIAANGGKAAEFQKVFESKQVDAKMQRADVLNRRYRVQETPLFVVNGKYTATIASAGGEDELLALLTDLAVREHDR